MNYVFISGITSDIGKSLAKMFAKKGYYILGTYHQNKEDALNLQKENCFAHKIKIYKCDLKKEEDIIKIVNDLIKNNIIPKILINNAAISCDNDIDSKTKEEFMEVLEVNLVGTFLMIKHFAKLMQDGIIINVASTDGINTYNEINFDYSASKAGVINLTKSLALIYHNLKIYSISPNWVKTKNILEMNSDYLIGELKKNKQGRLITVEEIGKCIEDLMNHDYSSGDNFIVDVNMENKLVWRKYNG